MKSHDWSNQENFKECWNETYDQRQEMLSQMTTIDYITTFPYTLQSDTGYEIVRT